ncbi:7-cyano-7-deazaguanine synthase [Thermoplasmatales archaeon SG8-52-2]|nr:MAG: 7-cyano-7-deazaguanine synthase [Thermoplasmatales archaeon SG8-52-2]
MNKKAVCLISGGIDSSVSAYYAKSKKFSIYALTIRYGQQHKKEINSAKKIANSLGVKDHIILNIDISKFGGSSLTDSSIDIESNRDLNEIGSNIPSTYVPARNTIFLSIALAYAESLDAEDIFIGLTSSDYSGYPDCRSEYIKAFQKMANLATKKGIEKKFIKINTPLINKSKPEIIKLGINLKVPFEKTWSCYKGGKKGCGRCDSCQLRLNGFKNIKAKDPIEYDYLPDWYQN